MFVDTCGRIAYIVSFGKSISPCLVALLVISTVIMSQSYLITIHRSCRQCLRHVKRRESFIASYHRWFTSQSAVPSENLKQFSDIPDESMASEQSPIHIDYPNFSFEVKKTSSTSKARTGLLTTPHGQVNTPNFIFCATKAAMKAVTAEHFRQEGTEIILSNTYHLMLQPGADVVEKLGGLQTITAWRGPMLTDSGGYQIFSMGHGSVSNEVKGKRNAETQGWVKTLLDINEEGAKFRSYADGSIHTLTPEKCMDIQRQLGADLIVVLDECTPFNVERQYTEKSMHRSHRWALRCLKHFKKMDAGNQALYGIIQGGVYEDLRVESTTFANNHPFFGIAIGGSLGANKKDMHHIVAYTRALLRDDRPVHLLGIGGIRDIFHGVRQGIDTFDCVHPTRLGRHGGALVRAEFWNEAAQDEEESTETKIITETMPTVNKFPPQLRNRLEKLTKRKQDRLGHLKKQMDHLVSVHSTSGTEETNISDQIEKLEKNIEATEMAIVRMPAEIWNEYRRGQEKQFLKQQVHINNKAINITSQKQQSFHGKIREHIHLSRANLREDPRPIDKSCTCYTCRNFSRGYLHHLIKAGESLGGTLVTIHNIAFMNRMMRDIRRGIAEDCLDEIEKEYIHPELTDSIGDTLSIGN